MRLIICFGPPRSGSTWAFNVTSQLVNATKYSYHMCFVNKKGKGLESSKKDIKNKNFLIIKIHNIKILQLIIENLSYRSKSCFFILSLILPSPEPRTIAVLDGEDKWFLRKSFASCSF